MAGHASDPIVPPSPGQAASERVAKALARAGVASRREVERLIAAGRVSLNGKVLTTPAVKVGPTDVIAVDGRPVAAAEPARLWRYHKPVGLVTTHRDPQGRPTVFERLPTDMPRVISIGRLDLNSEGLLLLTNDGELARAMELPSSGVVRRYRARVRGQVSQAILDDLRQGLSVDGVRYGPIEARLEATARAGVNRWITLCLAEGKNREVRKVLAALGLTVGRLIRTAYGPHRLGELKPGEVAEAAVGGTADPSGAPKSKKGWAKAKPRPGGLRTGRASRAARSPETPSSRPPPKAAARPRRSSRARRPAPAEEGGPGPRG
jgi:23S rRNA pseudouridine2605 synthase